MPRHETVGEKVAITPLRYKTDFLGFRLISGGQAKFARASPDLGLCQVSEWQDKAPKDVV